MRICLMMVDFPDSPAPMAIRTMSIAVSSGIRTQQQDLDGPIHGFLVALENLVYPLIPLRRILFHWISGFGAHATHCGGLKKQLDLGNMLAIRIGAHGCWHQMRKAANSQDPREVNQGTRQPSQRRSSRH